MAPLAPDQIADLELLCAPEWTVLHDYDDTNIRLWHAQGLAVLRIVAPPEDGICVAWMPTERAHVALRVHRAAIAKGAVIA